MSKLRELAYQLDPVLWVREVLGVEPTAWQMQFLRAPRGASIIALAGRQAGKTTTAAWAIAFSMVFTPGSLSVIACPAQRQSGEAVRSVRALLLKIGAELKSDHVYGLELTNGSRVLALPGSDDSIRGLTVDGWIVADEAARLTDDLIAALRPMRARRPQTRLAMLSTAWSHTDPFWKAWTNDDPSWLRLKATADIPGLYAAEFLEQELRAMGQDVFNRKYLGIPGGGAVSPFSWDLYERATEIHEPLVRPGPVFQPPPVNSGTFYNPNDVKTWGVFKPLFIVHDVARSHDRATAVIGGNSPYGRQLLGIDRAEELPQNLYGSALAGALMRVDAEYNRNALIVVDLSNDPTYAETLYETFGQRVIGVHISRHGDGTTCERRQVRNGWIPVYPIGRTFLLDLLLSELRSHQVRFADEPMMRFAYQQLANLELEVRDSGIVYGCQPGQHDDLAISFAMLAWAARHLHLTAWLRNLENAIRPRRRREKFDWAAACT